MLETIGNGEATPLPIRQESFNWNDLTNSNKVPGTLPNKKWNELLGKIVSS